MYFARQKGAAAARAVRAAREDGDGGRKEGSLEGVEEGFEEFEDLQEMEKREFGNVARVGAFAQFFVATDPGVARAGPGVGGGEQGSRLGGSRLVFGCTGTGSEEGWRSDPEEETRQRLEGGDGRVEVYDGFFGVRAERGFGVGEVKVDVPGSSVTVDFE